MRGCDRVRSGGDEIRIGCGSFGQMIESLALVETGHLHRVFHRRALAVDRERSVSALRDRNDAAIDLWGKRAADLKFVLAGGLALRKRRVIEIGKADRALDFERTVAGEKHRRRMGIDPTHLAVPCRVGQEGEHLVLHFVVGCRGCGHALPRV